MLETPPPTRDRVLSDGTREWSIRDTAWDKVNHTYRLGVAVQGGWELIELFHRLYTSKSETAEPTGADDIGVNFSIEEARWLLEILPQAIEQAEKNR